jgi:fused signal recognition particle receptor
MVSWAKALEKTRKSFFGKVSSMLLGKRSIDYDDIEQIEETLLGADMPVRIVDELIERLEDAGARKGQSPVELLRSFLLEELSAPPALEWRRADRPFSVLIVGVNGTGKTTSTAKLAQQVLNAGLKPVLGASDTFRAAGSEQLRLWGERIGCRVVTGRQGGDASAVAFDTMQAALAESADVAIVDTAGRMHTRAPLMEELKKVRRALDKACPGAPDETWVVLDATQGQNTLQQARVFNEMVPLTGALVTKLDGSAKAGFLFAVNRELKIPILFAGLGEGEHDLVAFDPTEFVDALLSESGED